MEQEASHNKTKGVRTAGPAELKAAPKRLGGAQRASGMGGGSGTVLLLLLQKEVLQFLGAVFLCWCFPASLPFGSKCSVNF